MPSQIDTSEQSSKKSGETRRSFLAKLGIGAAALALVAGSFSVLRGTGSNDTSVAKNMEFPGEDSIFHPAVDPRQDPRRNTQA